ncbi:cAMP and cAMP-inhibited cGMP 3',5'-cyclic phosphodiesterase 10A-like [Patiria miniata]|uniref:Phosphodiesterase n=1 Tax=Patiria miniata TaxID=46514 RepID=A0A914BT23_PATMI|nr:cAMP and cAMP-inhibited cGMP 3',5'-cyclic phosphodiesterase 10A-like [Patiria miniata]
MSSPWKQVSGRRMPPLPGNSSPSIFGRRGPSGECADIGLNPTNVKMYLNANPWLVADFLKENSNNDEVQKILNSHCVQFQTDTSYTHSGRCSRLQSVSKESLTNTATTDRQEMLNSMVNVIEEAKELPKMLYHLSTVIVKAIEADDFFLYTVSTNGKDMHLCRECNGKIQEIMFGPVIPGTTISAYVAAKKEAILVEDILGDERFPRGAGIENSNAQSVLCLPVLLPNGDLPAVLQLSRNYGSTAFTEENLEIASTYMLWAGISLNKVQMCKGLMKQREFNDFLLEVSRVIFDDIVAIDTLTEHIIMFAKSLVNADRCALFLLDPKTEELYADLFDEGKVINGQPIFTKKQQIRFSIEKGIAGHVARTGEVVNIPDAYSDERFNREVDIRTGYTTRSILCMPIMSHGSVIGVVQLINKKDPSQHAFGKTDESNFRMFAVYCALALHYSKVYSSILHCERVLGVTQEQLAFHTVATSEDADRLLSRWTKRTIIPDDLDSFEFDCRPHTNILCDLLLHMTLKLCGEDCFDLETLARFLLTVKKNYRPNPFHNFAHAFNVAHCMYALLMHSPGVFADFECQAMFIATICHDLDHRGTTNALIQKSDSPLADLYASSILENHHYQTTMNILQHSGLNVFARLPVNTYKQVIGLIQHCILSTDLMLYFGNRQEVAKLLLSQGLDITNTAQRPKIQALMMTACDLCATAKLWPNQREAVDCLYQEFYAQGDEEKKRGEQPMEMMDRDQHHTLPKQQIGFLTNVALPCFSTLSEIIPPAKFLLEGCKDNLVQWQQETKGKSTAMWEPGVSRLSPSKK